VAKKLSQSLHLFDTTDTIPREAGGLRNTRGCSRRAIVLADFEIGVRNRSQATVTTSDGASLLPNGSRDSLGVRLGDFDRVAIHQNVRRAKNRSDDGIDLGKTNRGRMSVSAFGEFDVNELVHSFVRFLG
jgi:hypothetical protein